MRSSSGRPGHEAVEQRLHRFSRQGLERERGRVPQPGRPLRLGVQPTRAGRAQPRGSRDCGTTRADTPTNSSSGASAHCMSSKTSTTGSRSRVVRRRDATRRTARPARDPSAPRETGAGRRAAGSTRVPRRLRQRSSRAASSFDHAVVIVLALGDACAHPDHLGERPVRHAVAVGQATAAVPDDVLRDAVEVLVELPGKPRLADAGDAR